MILPRSEWFSGNSLGRGVAAVIIVLGYVTWLSHLTFAQFFIGIIATDHTPSVNSVPESQNQSDSTRFTPMSAGRGKSSDGTVLSYQLYEASDGSGGVVATIELRGTASKARRELRHRLAFANKILDSGPKRNKAGKVIGERYVALFAPRQGFGPQAAILWTEGSDLHYIESRSLATALEFERQHYR